MLPELLPLAALLGSVPEWERDAAGVSALTLRALNAVAADYQQQGDAVSAAILLEAALRRWGLNSLPDSSQLAPVGVRHRSAGSLLVC